MNVEKKPQENLGVGVDNLSNSFAERAVIGGVLKYGQDAYIEVSDLVRPNFFTIEPNRIVYECIQSIFEETPGANLEQATILSRSKTLGYGEFFYSPSEAKHLRALFNYDVLLENIQKEAVTVAKLAVAREIHGKMREVQKEIEAITGEESLGEILAIPENKLLDFAHLLDKENKIVKLGANATEWIDNLIANPRDCIGISTGLPVFDDLIGGGIRTGPPTFVAARMKSGKSFFGNFVGLNVAKRGIPVLLLDTEMDDEQQKARVFSRLAKIPKKRIEKGEFGQNPAEVKRMRDADVYLNSLPYEYINIAGTDFPTVLSLVRRWLVKTVGQTNGVTNDCLLIYDYFKLVDSSGLKRMEEHQALGFMLMTLNNFLIRHKVPCLSFVQTNRAGATEMNAETVSASDRIAMFCSSLSILSQKAQDEIDEDGRENGNRKLATVLTRNGEPLEEGDYINIAFDGDFCEFKELQTRNELKKDEENDYSSPAFDMDS